MSCSSISNFHFLHPYFFHLFKLFNLEYDSGIWDIIFNLLASAYISTTMALLILITLFDIFSFFSVSSFTRGLVIVLSFCFWKIFSLVQNLVWKNSYTFLTQVPRCEIRGIMRSLNNLMPKIIHNDFQELYEVKRSILNRHFNFLNLASKHLSRSIHMKIKKILYCRHV